MVDAICQQGYHEIQASKIHNILAKFIPDSKTSQSGAYFAQNTAVICEGWGSIRATRNKH